METIFFFSSFSTETRLFDSFLKLRLKYAFNPLLLTPDSDSAGKNTKEKYSLHPRTDRFFFLWACVIINDAGDEDK